MDSTSSYSSANGGVVVSEFSHFNDIAITGTRERSPLRELSSSRISSTSGVCDSYVLDIYHLDTNQMCMCGFPKRLHREEHIFHDKFGNFSLKGNIISKNFILKMIIFIIVNRKKTI